MKMSIVLVVPLGILLGVAVGTIPNSRKPADTNQHGHFSIYTSSNRMTDYLDRDITVTNWDVISHQKPFRYIRLVHEMETNYTNNINDKEHLLTLWPGDFIWFANAALICRITNDATWSMITNKFTNWMPVKLVEFIEEEQ